MAEQVTSGAERHTRRDRTRAHVPIPGDLGSEARRKACRTQERRGKVKGVQVRDHNRHERSSFAIGTSRERKGHDLR